MCDFEIENLKAYSVLWRNGEWCSPRSAARNGGEHFVRCNDPLDFLELPEPARQALLDWIDGAFTASDVPHHASSYCLKHDYQRDTGNYVTNGQFKGAMIQYGYDPVDPREVNCHYRVNFPAAV